MAGWIPNKGSRPLFSALAASLAFRRRPRYVAVHGTWAWATPLRGAAAGAAMAQPPAAAPSVEAPAPSPAEAPALGRCSSPSCYRRRARWTSGRARRFCSPANPGAQLEPAVTVGVRLDLEELTPTMSDEGDVHYPFDPWEFGVNGASEKARAADEWPSATCGERATCTEPNGNAPAVGVERWITSCYIESPDEMEPASEEGPAQQTHSTPDAEATDCAEPGPRCARKPRKMRAAVAPTVSEIALDARG